MPDHRSRLPAVFMLLGSISSMQVGSALATFLFDQAGVGGAVFLRSALAAMILVPLWRPVLRMPPKQLWLVFLFGASVAGATLGFYEAINRMPLGTAVTIEFIGPLGVALFTSRRRRDVAWAVMAAVGILLLTGGVEGSSLDPIGVASALAAGIFWASYIIVGTKLGDGSTGGSLLSMALVISAVLCLPLGVIDGGTELFSPSVLAVGLVVAVLSAAIPYSLEFEAMRWLPSNVFGVMMSLEPAIAALIGFIILGQHVEFTQAIAIALVVAASAGALHSTRRPAQVEP